MNFAKSEGEVLDMAGGRPPKYETVDEMQQAIDKYFESCWEDRVIYNEDGTVKEKCRVMIKPYTVTGLALGLGMTRRGLLDYEEKGEFAHTVKIAKSRVEEFAESHLFTARNATGAIFSLKNNYGWKDKQELEHTGADGGPLIFKWEGE